MQFPEGATPTQKGMLLTAVASRAIKTATADNSLFKVAQATGILGCIQQAADLSLGFLF